MALIHIVDGQNIACVHILDSIFSGEEYVFDCNNVE